jgi:N-acetylmuramoyl-L-alanine amidase
MAFDRQYAATVIDAEAENQPAEARLGVAWSLLNRHWLNPARYGHTIAEVCTKPYQYSEFNNDALDRANLGRVLRKADTDPAILDALAQYDAAVADTPDPTGGATHFWADPLPTPSWAAHATLCPKLGSINFAKDVP